MKTFNFSKVVLLFCVLFNSNFTSFAQQEQILGFATELWQSNLTNPALLPEKKFNIMLGSGHFNFKSDHPASDFIKVDPENGKRQLIDSVVLNSLTPSNKVNANYQIQTIGVSFPVSPNIRLSVHQAFVGEGNFDLSGDLARILYRGNAQFNGKTVSLGSSLNFNTRSEIAVGLAYTFSAFTIGARIKYLNGYQSVFTPKYKADATLTSNAQQLTVNADYLIRSFGLAGDIANFKGVGDLFSDNTGYSFDLGATIKLGKIKLAASILDIGGFINWKADPRTLSMTTNATYSGADVSNFFKYGNYDGGTFADSLKKYFNYSDTKTGTFKQTLPLRFYLSGTYDLTEAWRVGALISGENGGSIDNSNTGVIVDVTRKFGNIFTLGVATGVKDGLFSTIGVHSTLKLGPVQLYGLTDNIVTLTNFLYNNTNSKISNAKTANVRIGLNLVF